MDYIYNPTKFLIIANMRPKPDHFDKIEKMTYSKRVTSPASNHSQI